MEALKTQTLSDAIDRNLIRCYRCRSFTTTDSEGLYANCFYTRSSEYKYPGDLKVDSYDLVDIEEAKALE